MSRKSSIVLFFTFCLVAWAIPVDPTDPCERAYRSCDFRFFEDDEILPTLYVDNAHTGEARTTKILSRVPGEYIGVLNSNVEKIAPEFVFSYYWVPAWIYGSPHMSRNQFKAFPLSKEDEMIFGKGSGIGYQSFQDNQLEEIDGKCLRIFFTNYQILDGYDGSVVGEMNDVPRSENKCAVIRLRSN